ncbi:GNAT family N-acetyltransferase [Enterococcus hermanniensis]|uniref:N-acetyltransferase domain-containing protein n=1 Tax=Enterococcus hermanniensis TaxID=249189 RepID=A0A1L8TQL4_9ENTE|nr:GNAT family N-acetyltransferase [Enterococcus hermanniensis]OJG46478.1 hypothetical protein RV04_GL000906 [Enterococcus hermanniensis]
MEKIFNASPFVQAAAFYLRYHVFVLEQSIPPTLEFDRLDTSDRAYLVIFDGTVPIATVRYQTTEKTCLNPDRLCVHPDYRNLGLGTDLLRVIEKRALDENCTTSKLSAETTAQAFYEKNGYSVISAIFEEDGIPCVEMKKDLVSK